MRAVLAVSLAVILAGCGEGERESLPDALASLNRDLIKAHVVYPDNVDNDVGRVTFANALRTIQAQFCEPNPSVMMLLKDFDLKLEGSFSTDTSATGDASPTAPGANISFKVTTSRTQTLDLPITVTSLTNIPNAYQAYLVTITKDSPQPTVDKARIVTTIQALREVVGAAVSHPTFMTDNPKCAQPQTSSSSGAATPLVRPAGGPPEFHYSPTDRPVPVQGHMNLPAGALGIKPEPPTKP